MATLTLYDISTAGLDGSNYTAAAAGGDQAPNGGDTFLHVKNANGGATRTVTVTPATAARLVAQLGSVTVPTVAVVVAASGEAMIGPFNPRAYNNGNGRLVITYSDSAADLTVKAIRLKRATG